MHHLPFDERDDVLHDPFTGEGEIVRWSAWGAGASWPSSTRRTGRCWSRTSATATPSRSAGS